RSAQRRRRASARGRGDRADRRHWPGRRARLDGRGGRTGALMTLEQIIEGIRPMIANGSRPTKERIRVFWAGAKIAREVGAVDAIHRAFMQLAIDTDLIDGRGRWTGADVADHVRGCGAEDIAHVIRWALRGWNPFEKWPLQ